MSRETQLCSTIQWDCGLISLLTDPEARVAAMGVAAAMETWKRRTMAPMIQAATQVSLLAKSLGVAYFPELPLVVW